MYGSEYLEGRTRPWLREPQAADVLMYPALGRKTVTAMPQAAGGKPELPEPGAPGLPLYQLSSESDSSDPCGTSHAGARIPFQSLPITKPLAFGGVPRWSGKANPQKFPLIFRVSSPQLFPCTFEILIILLTALNCSLFLSLQRLLQGLRQQKGV